MENREQPTMEPATTLDKVNEDRAVSDVGSQGQLGKFKDANALLTAYNNLQAEFTRKCQLLKSLQQDKIDGENKPADSTEDSEIEENNEKITKNSENNDENAKLSSDLSAGGEENNQDDYLQSLSQFLEENELAKDYAEEIENYLQGNRIKNPYEDAWANVVLNHIKVKQSDPLISRYVLTSDDVKNKIIENYLKELSNQKPPYVISSQGGQRVSGVIPDSPKTLEEAKKLVNNMFS